MNERIRELEQKYKYFIIKKYLKIVVFFCLITIFCTGFYIMLEKQNEQQILIAKSQEEKRILEARINEAKINAQKLKLAKELNNKVLEFELEETKKILAQQESQIEMLQEQKIQISSNNLNIATLRHAFYQNPSYEKAILLAQTYLDMKDYNKSIFWSLKANDINKISNTSWKLFAKAKQAQGFEEDAKKVLELYAKHYEVELLQ